MKTLIISLFFLTLAGCSSNNNPVAGGESDRVPVLTVHIEVIKLNDTLHYSNRIMTYDAVNFPWENTVSTSNLPPEVRLKINSVWSQHDGHSFQITRNGNAIQGSKMGSAGSLLLDNTIQTDYNPFTDTYSLELYINTY